MPKNVKKGKKITKDGSSTRELRLPFENEFVALIKKNIGDMRFSIETKDRQILVAKLKGSLVKKCRLQAGMFVLVERVLNLNEIIHVYTSTESKDLIEQEYFILSKEDMEESIVSFDEDKEINIDDI